MLNTKTIKIQENNLTYILNEETKTAILIGCDLAYGNITIPKSVQYKNEEFIVTKIAKNSIKFSVLITSIRFPYDSKLEIIEKNAISCLNIENIIIPSSVIKLEDGWFEFMSDLKNIIIDQNNQIYKNYNDEIVIEKSSINKSEYDILVFASRDKNNINISIPPFIKKIAPHAFESCNIEEITIPSSVTEICKKAFQKCHHLRHIHFQPNSKLQIIGKQAFEDTIIKTILIPASVVELKGDCFLYMMNLKRVIIDKNNKIYKNYDDRIVIGKSDPNSSDYDTLVFAVNDQEMKTLTIPPFIKKIGSAAFFQCSIKGITIPSQVTSIGNGAFCCCAELTQIEFEENSQLQIIGDYAFNCTSIKKIIIPPHVTYIGKKAFQANFDCIKQFEIPPNSELKIINKYAFSNVQSIKSFSIPSTLIELKEGWCEGLRNLTKIKIAENNSHFIYYNNEFLIGKTNSKNDEFDILLMARRDIRNATIPPFVKIIGSYAFDNSNVEKVIIPSQVVRIGKCAFNNCENLKRIEFLPDSQLKILGKNAFYYCPIESITIPPHVTILKERTFYYCRNLKKVDFSDNSELQIIEDEAFNVSSIESLTIPSSVKNLGKYWCRNTPNLTNIEIGQNNENYKILDDKMIIGKSDSKSSEFDTIVFADRKAKEIKIPSFIKQIYPCAFNKCSIENISIPSQVKVIHESAFYNCTNLQRVEISPNSELEIISSGAFSCTKLTEFTIPEKLTSISYESFANCRIKKINFSSNSKIKVIDNLAFCQSDIESITIPSSVVELKDGWCRSAYSLGHVIIDKNNQMLRNYDDNLVIGKSDINESEFDVLVFASRSIYIKNITIPPFIKKIAPNAFEFCSIENIIIPSNITEIGAFAFANCSRLRRFDFEANSKLKIIKEEVFEKTIIESISFPKHLIEIDIDIYACKELQIIEFEDNSELKYINVSSCIDFETPFIMIPVKTSNDLF